MSGRNHVIELMRVRLTHRLMLVNKEFCYRSSEPRFLLRLHHLFNFFCLALADLYNDGAAGGDFTVEPLPVPDIIRASHSV